ncbi:MAG: mechanosensitive ion channel family protein [Propionibacteriaceae bacterium]|nr:mechanosensitive ion channel family protein [Propionibacteriaceae bacterium]
MPDDDSRDQTDAQFRELIRAQFGEEVRGHAPIEGARPDDFRDFFDFDAALEHAEPVYDERWIAPVPDPIRRPSNPKALLGLVIGVLSGTLAALALIGVSLPGWVGVAAFVGFGVGLALLLSALPKKSGAYDDFDDGARL